MTAQNDKALGAAFGLAVFVLMNVVQIGASYAFSGLDQYHTYGFPYPVYEYVALLSRGWFLVWGLIADLLLMLLFAAASGILFPLLFRRSSSKATSITQIRRD
jgi:hypothetical protein